MFLPFLFVNICTGNFYSTKMVILCFQPILIKDSNTEKKKPPKSIIFCDFMNNDIRTYDIKATHEIYYILFILIFTFILFIIQLNVIHW